MRFRYTVIEEGTEHEKYLEVEKRTSEDIDSFHMEASPALAEMLAYSKAQVSARS